MFGIIIVSRWCSLDKVPAKQEHNLYLITNTAVGDSRASLELVALSGNPKYIVLYQSRHRELAFLWRGGLGLTVYFHYKEGEELCSLKVSVSAFYTMLRCL